MTNTVSIKHGCSMPDHGSEKASSECCRPSSSKYMGDSSKGVIEGGAFFGDQKAWIKASKNTLNCLIGCSIGDFGMIIYLNAYHPSTPLWLMMMMAMSSGLLSSLILESIILKIKEKFSWSNAIKMAFSMSFISMLGMELAENSTDFFLTGGVTAMSDPWYWWALLIALMAGFLVPLPYNYYKFKKHGQSCH